VTGQSLKVITVQIHKTQQLRPVRMTQLSEGIGKKKNVHNVIQSTHTHTYTHTLSHTLT